MWKFLPETLKCQKWWSVCLQTKWLWVRIPLLSLNVFVLWDVNVHHKDWLTYSGGTDRSSELCCNFSISNYFTQMVKFPPWIPDCGSHSPALLDFFLSCDASICSTMAFPPLGNSDDVVSVSINFPSYSQREAPFRCIVCDYSHADWNSLCDHLRDFPWEDIFKPSASTAASKFCEWFPWFSAACAASVVHRNHFFCLY